MTLICSHRINTVEQLRSVPFEYGVEIDLHSAGDDLVLAHDPFVGGERFVTWLEAYRHTFIVLNVKEEGLESRITRILDERGISNWAFLDQSLPFLVKSLRSGERRCMVRISEFESVQTPLLMPAAPDWVWVDSFTGAWPRSADLVVLREAGFRFMLVSPELQGRDPDTEIERIVDVFGEAHLTIDAVCTKRADLWHHPEATWWAP